MGGDEPRREDPPCGQGDVLAEHDEHGGLEGVGAAGHPQVRPGPHERPEQRVGGERGDPRGGVDVEAEPAAADGGGRGNGIRPTLGGDHRRADVAHRQRHREQAPLVPDPDEPTVPGRAVGQHLDVVEARHGMRDQEGPQGRQVDELGGHPVIKPHATVAGQVFECRLGLLG